MHTVKLKALISLSGLGLIGSDSKLLGVHLVEFLLLLYFLSEGSVVVGEIVDLLVELIYVLIDEVVLLLVLEEGRGDFLEVASPTLLFYLLEALPDGCHRLLVVLNDPHTFLILVDQLSQSKFDQWLSVSGLVLLLSLALPLEEVSTAAKL